MPSTVTGADIPEELFETIIHCAVRPHDLLWSRPSAEVTQQLCTYALVSRYFASVCRPCLFRHVSLTSYAKARGLVDLIDAAAETQLISIATLIEYFELEPGAGDFPWIHIVALALLPKLGCLAGNNKHLFMNLKLTQLFGFGHSATSHPFPRSLPPLLFSHIIRLTLTDIHVEAGDDLVRYITALPRLSFLGLEDVTWCEPPSFSAIGRFPSTFRQVTSKELPGASDSCAPWFSVQFLNMQTCDNRARPRDAAWCPVEQTAVEEMLQALRSPSLSSQDRIHWKILSFKERVMVNRWTEGQEKDTKGRSYYIKVNLPFPQSLPRSVIPLHPDGSLHKHVRRIDITPHTEDWDNSDAAVPAIASMCTSFASGAAELQYLTNLTFSFRTSESLVNFVTLYHDTLQPLDQTKVLRYYDKTRGLDIIPDFLRVSSSW